MVRVLLDSLDFVIINIKQHNDAKHRPGVSIIGICDESREISLLTHGTFYDSIMLFRMLMIKESQNVIMIWPFWATD